MQRAKPPQPPRPSLSFGLAAGGLASLLGLCASGCTPAIGDHCTLATDCSVQGNRICDTFEPNGYCTVTCSANSCPDNSSCIEFAAGIPGCGYNDYAAPSRLGRSMCMKTCGSNSDCRTDEGYSCVSTRTLGPTVAVLDTNQTQSICMVAPSVADDGGSASLPACMSDLPDAPALDLPVSQGEGVGPDAAADGQAGTVDGGVEAGGVDGGADVEASGEGGAIAADGGDAASGVGGDATVDGGDDGSDATLGQPTDAGAADAPDEP